jgi:hypothetical protein
MTCFWPFRTVQFRSPPSKYVQVPLTGIRDPTRFGPLLLGPRQVVSDDHKWPVFDPFGPVRSDLENPPFDAYVEYRFITIRFRTCRFWTGNDPFWTSRTVKSRSPPSKYVQVPLTGIRDPARFCPLLASPFKLVIKSQIVTPKTPFWPFGPESSVLKFLK